MNKILLAWLAAGVPAFAGLKFDEPSKEVTAAPDAQKVEAEFTFTNTGTDTVVIDHQDAACTCISSEIKGAKMSYQPGESGVIRGAFDVTNFAGTVDKQIMLYLKGDPANRPSHILTVKVKIPVLVEVEPKTLTWDLGGPATPKTATLTMNYSSPIHVKDVSGTNPAFTYEVKTIEEGKKYEVIVTPQATSEVGLAVFHIDTDCAIPRHRSQRVFGVIRKAQETPTAAVPK